jgi:hypothetical protein
MPTYRIDPETGKAILKADWLAKYGEDDKLKPSFQIMKDIDPFVSPIDQTVISSRPQLEAHNKRHGVTNIADYSQQHFDTKAKERSLATLGQTEADKQDRKAIIANELEKRGV